MDGIVRRPSGVYVARVSVPNRLRHLVGKTELIASTGVRDLPVARIVGGYQLATWRQRFLELERTLMGSEIDVIRALEGSPQLGLGGHLPLSEAAAASGVGQDALLRAASERRMTLYYHAFALLGHRMPLDALPIDVLDEYGTKERVIPTPRLMPDVARQVTFTGLLAVPASADVAAGLFAGPEVSVVVLAIPGGGQDVFVPVETLRLTRTDVRLAAADVDAQRRRVAHLITPDQIESAKAARALAVDQQNPLRRRPLKDSVKPFLADHKKPRGAEQTERVRSACLLFLELMGPDLRGLDLNRELVRQFRDERLPQVPEHENKVRLQEGSRNILESIEAVAGTDWPRMSPAQQVKRMNWVCSWLQWLGNEGWTQDDLTAGLVGGGAAGRSASKARSATRDQDRRDAFTDVDLRAIFGAAWFRDGAGELTRVRTYRTWMPYRTWLPLLGLLTGARLNELAQLRLDDVRANRGGVWVIDIDEDDESESGPRRKLKNNESRRLVPIHSELIRIGLIKWTERLRDEGFDRLFPELHFDANKGYGKAATKWFSGFMKSLGYPRDSRKVFHSFRHTMANTLQQNDGIKSEIVSQLMGHSRGETTTKKTYRKDAEAASSDSPLVKAVEALRFDCLADVALFDSEAGLQALRDALRRRR